MKKKILALFALVMCLTMLAGCMSTEGLKKVPQGVRPESLDMESLELQFPSDTSIKNQMLGYVGYFQRAENIDEQRELYAEFLYDAFVYIVGPYNYTHYLTADGRSISAYYDTMINHINSFLSDWDVSAWEAIDQSGLGAQLRAEQEKLMCTPESLRSVYPSTSDVQTLVVEMYNARDALASGIETDFAQSNEEELLSTLISERKSLANAMSYDSYPQYIVEKRDKMPYDLESLLKLAQIVKENLAPAVKNAQSFDVPELSAQEWSERLPALVQRFPAYEEDLSYVLNNGVYAVEEGEKSTHFVYSLYQYDVSAGKAVLAGEEDDALHVLYGLGLEARNMALEQDQWSISALTTYDAVQKSAFTGAALNDLDTVFDDKAPEAEQALVNQMARDVCRAAMELELMVALHDDPDMAQADREQLVADLSAQYGLDDMEEILTESSDLLVGNMDCAGRMLGGLYGLTLYNLDVQDNSAADQVLSATLSVYNAGNPISAGYSAGLENPYSTQGIQGLSELVK